MNPYDFEFQLIKEVQHRPFLYDSQHPSHCKRDLNEKAWQELAIIFNKSVPDSRRRWKSLRDGFSSRIRNQVNDGTPEEFLKWPYWKSLQFLRPFLVQKRVRGGPADSLEETSNDDYSESGSVTAGIEVKTESEDEPEPEGIAAAICQNLPNLTEPTSSALVRRQLQPAANPYKRQKSSMDQTDPFGLDEDGHFGQSVAHRLRGFAPKDKAKAKIRIEQILFEIEFGETC